jgi:hypothetical protein
MHLLWKLPRSDKCFGRTTARRELTSDLSGLHADVDAERCYDCRVFNFGKPKTPGQWIGHVLAAIVALFLLFWLVRVYVL